MHFYFVKTAQRWLFLNDHIIDHRKSSLQPNNLFINSFSNVCSLYHACNINVRILRLVSCFGKTAFFTFLSQFSQNVLSWDSSQRCPTSFALCDSHALNGDRLETFMTLWLFWAKTLLRIFFQYVKISVTWTRPCDSPVNIENAHKWLETCWKLPHEYCLQFVMNSRSPVTHSLY